MRQKLEQCSYKLKNVKDCQEPQEARKRQEMILPYHLQREHGPANTLILDFYPPELTE